jgi:hypothetical protein
MWPADSIGQTHSIDSPEGFWNCDGTKAKVRVRVKAKVRVRVKAEVRVTSY